MPLKVTMVEKHNVQQKISRHFKTAIPGSILRQTKVKKQMPLRTPDKSKPKNITIQIISRDPH
mgnify:CR=1 FL=1